MYITMVSGSIIINNNTYNNIQYKYTNNLKPNTLNIYCSGILYFK